MGASNGPSHADVAAIEQAARVLRRGGLVVFPTETVYGLGANALDAAAVARVFEIKDRPRFDPLIVHVADINTARLLVAQWPPQAARLAEAFWPGSLTLVLPKRFGDSPLTLEQDSVSEPRPVIPDLVTAGLRTVGVRVPDHPVALDLIRRAAVPVAAPSANRFGRVSPTRFEHVAPEFADRVDLVLDGGPCAAGLESTVVCVAPESPRPEARGTQCPVVLRLGAVPVEAIGEVVGPVSVAPTQTAAESRAGEAAQPSPGRLERHYAPRTPLRLVKNLDGLAVGPRMGLLTMGAVDSPQEARGVTGGFAAVEVLSRSGDLREAAANLFAAIRRLDAAGLDQIIALPVPEIGLGRAINDRLRRASCDG